MESAEVYKRYALARGSPDRGFDKEVALGVLKYWSGEREVYNTH
jgi:hypothetical protein